MAAAVECECDGNIPVTPTICARRSTSIERHDELRLERSTDAGRGRGPRSSRAQASPVAGADFVAAVDPVNADGRLPARSRTCRSTDYDAVLVCIPDEPKIELLTYCSATASTCWSRSRCGPKHESDIAALEALARRNGVVCYTAYNHRFEPHFVRMRDLIASGRARRDLSCRMFYGNGTARLVRDSAWRDQGAGVLPDLGSHLLDTCRFWFGDIDDEFRVRRRARLREPRARPCRHRIARTPRPRIELEMTLLMWRNHFTCDILAEKRLGAHRVAVQMGAVALHPAHARPAERPPAGGDR